LKGQAALDPAVHNKIEPREVKALAVDATRQYSKQVIELTGDGLPIRTPEAEKAPKNHAIEIFEDFFLLGVSVDNIAVTHFKSNWNEMFIRFLEFGPESPHDLVLKRSIHLEHRNTKIYARICECRGDTRITFLL
jgi:hypothetical protein